MGDSELNPAFHVGQRIHDAMETNVCGTVRYVGHVEGQRGLWYGVEWDNPARGKHDGSTGGKKYFQCHVAGSGSFVRAHRIGGGVTVKEALLARYVTQEDSHAGDSMYIFSRGHRVVPVELVGRSQVAKRQAHIENLQSACLAGTAVSSAGPAGELHRAASSLQELDLCGHLLPDWQEVSRVAQELPQLALLDLSRSRLQLRPLPLPSLGGLRSLVLNNTGLQWRQVALIERTVLQLEELRICHNHLSRIEVAGDPMPLVRGFDRLQLLDLEENCFESWAEIGKLAYLPRLGELRLSGNLLPHVSYQALPAGSPGEHSTTDDGMGGEGLAAMTPGTPFAALRTVLLGHNRIAGWAAVDALHCFPKLQEVRLSNNPLEGEAGEGALRFAIIARIANLTCLNGSQVKPRERRDSEIRYVREVMRHMSSKSDDEISAIHPRYLELKSKYGITIDTVVPSIPTGGLTPSQNFVSVKLKCAAAGHVGDAMEVTKKLPRSTSIMKLKLLISRQLRVPTANQSLFLTDEVSSHEIPLDVDSDTLGDLRLGPHPVVLVRRG